MQTPSRIQEAFDNNLTNSFRKDKKYLSFQTKIIIPNARVMLENRITRAFISFVWRSPPKCFHPRKSTAAKTYLAAKWLLAKITVGFKRF